jgi:cation diffusion facilitator family transporter
MDNFSASTDHAIRAPLTSAAVNSILAAAKIVAGALGNSYALIADGIESISDVISSLIIWGGLRVSVRPPNTEYPYGYGKAEALAGIAGATALLVAAVVIAVQSLYEIRTPHHLPHWSTLLVLAAVVVITDLCIVNAPFRL